MRLFLSIALLMMIELYSLPLHANCFEVSSLARSRVIALIGNATGREQHMVLLERDKIIEKWSPDGQQELLSRMIRGPWARNVVELTERKIAQPTADDYARTNQIFLNEYKKIFKDNLAKVTDFVAPFNETVVKINDHGAPKEPLRKDIDGVMAELLIPIKDSVRDEDYKDTPIDLAIYHKKGQALRKVLEGAREFFHQIPKDILDLLSKPVTNPLTEVVIASDNGVPYAMAVLEYGYRQKYLRYIGVKKGWREKHVGTKMWDLLQTNKYIGDERPTIATVNVDNPVAMEFLRTLGFDEYKRLTIQVRDKKIEEIEMIYRNTSDVTEKDVE